MTDHNLKQPTLRELDPRIHWTQPGEILDQGLHEFLRSCIDNTNELAQQIEIDYRFNK